MLESKLAAKDTLRGQPFIGKSVRYVDRFHGLYDSNGWVIVTVARECGHCFYRTLDESKDCKHPGEYHYTTVGKDGKSWTNATSTEGSSIVKEETKPSAKKIFRLKEEEHLPEQLGVKEVGNYCPYFIDERLKQKCVKMGERWLTPLIEYH